MEQELRIIIIQKRSRYRPDHESGASQEQFLSFVLDKAILQLMRLRATLKRGRGVQTVSLDQEIQNEEGDGQPLSETIAESCRFGGRPACSSSTADFLYDTERMFRRLNKEQREIGSLILAGYKPIEISTLIKMPRTTLQAEFRRMGELLAEDEGLKDYFPPALSHPENFSAKGIEDK